MHVITLWNNCVEHLRNEFPEQQFNTWIRPLQAEVKGEHLFLLAPNQFVKEWIDEKFLTRINEILSRLNNDQDVTVFVKVGTREDKQREESMASQSNISKASHKQNITKNESNLNKSFTFDNFVEGKSNQLARAAAMQVAENAGKAYNPMYIYGGVGLGKTHLLHAVGNFILKKNPNARVLYLHSERFVADMVKALQTNTINEFKRFYRHTDALFIDDIQFFAGKDRTQEEFFH
ncbi:MAG: DnaA/Hda family protein, partial [Gammaproteobacteria bacterium]